jgi:hypothetical protein
MKLLTVPTPLLLADFAIAHEEVGNALPDLRGEKVTALSAGPNPE